MSGLRIAVFAAEFPALSETFVIRQIAGLLERGHSVTVFADRPRREPLSHPDVERHGLRRRTVYLAMPSGRVARLAGAVWHLLRQPPRRALALLGTLNPLRHGRDAASLRLFYWAVRLMGRERFDVLHCHFGPVGEMVGSLRELGAVEGRLVTTFHGADLSQWLADGRDPYPLLRRRGDLFLPISDLLARRLAAQGFDPARIVVHRMGVDLARLPAVARARRPGRPLRVVTVGRLVEKKGVADGLRAVAEATRRQASLTYTIIGDGPLRSELEALARSLGIAEIVEFRGWQVHDAILESLARHDVLLAPSVTAADGDQEGIPVTLMEGMATAMPVVSTRHSGIPELIEHGVSGLLAEEGDVEELAEALRRLAGDPALARQLGAAARARVAAGHDARALDDALARRFETLCAAA